MTGHPNKRTEIIKIIKIDKIMTLFVDIKRIEGFWMD